MRSPEVRRRAGLVGFEALLLVALLAAPVLVIAAEPSATTAPAGDPRSAGQGPGLVGDPLWAILIVAGIALVSLMATLAYVRATADRGSDRRP